MNIILFIVLVILSLIVLVLLWSLWKVGWDIVAYVLTQFKNELKGGKRQ